MTLVSFAAMARRIAIELSNDESAWLDRVVSEGQFESHEAALHAALRRIQSPDDAEIAAAYRRAYGAVPEEKVWGDVGLRLAGQRVREDER